MQHALMVQLNLFIAFWVSLVGKKEEDKIIDSVAIWLVVVFVLKKYVCSSIYFSFLKD